MGEIYMEENGLQNMEEERGERNKYKDLNL